MDIPKLPVNVISKMSGPKLYVYDDYTQISDDRWKSYNGFLKKTRRLIASVGLTSLEGSRPLELDEMPIM